MLFCNLTKNREVAVISQLLAIFGTVEVRQMRALFSHLSDARFGRIMFRLEREGIVYHNPGGRYLSSSWCAAGRTDPAASVRTFWAFIRVKDRLESFCGGDGPVLVSVSNGADELDMIPVRADSAGEIAAHAAAVPKDVKRLLIVSSAEEADGLAFRDRNDFLMEVGEDGETGLYKIQGGYE